MEGVVSRLGNWWRYLRRRGVSASINTFIDRFVFRSYRCAITHSLVEGPPAADHVGVIKFRAAVPSDLNHLQEFARYGRGATRRYVEEDKDWLYVACDGDRIVATRRSSLVIRDNLLSRLIKLEPGQFWGADSFCLPEYRNRGIARHLKIFSDRHLASLGYKEFVSSIEVTNTASLSASRAAGRQVLYYVSFLRILGWERVRVSKDMPASLWDGLKRRREGGSGASARP
jgi:GNAT superfamily N-acetyltransferase